MSELTVKFELSDQDRGLLTEILQELKNDRRNCERCVKQMGDAVQNCLSTHPVDALPPATVEDVAQTDTPKRTRKKVTNEETKPIPAEPPKDEPKPEPVKEYTEKDVHDKVVALIRAGKRNEARGIVKEYASGVSGLPADKRAEVMKRLEAVE